MPYSERLRATQRENIEIRTKPVLVVGAGPAGLATAKCLQDQGLSVVVADRFGIAGGAYQRMYRDLTLASPATFLSLPGTKLDASSEYIRASQFASYLARYANLHRISVQKNDLAGIASLDAGVVVKFTSGYQAMFPAVVIATGMTDNPALPTIPGLELRPSEPSAFHAQNWPGPSSFRHSRVIIVGGGMRGVELAEECANAGLKPVLSARNARVLTWPVNFLGRDIRYLGFPLLHKLPVRLFHRHCTARWRYRAVDRGFRKHLAQGNISIVAEIAKIDREQLFLCDGSSMRADVIVFATGYNFAMPFLPKFIPRTEQGFPIVSHGHFSGLPNVYFMGLPCASRLDSNFIHGIAADSKTIATEIAGKLSAPVYNAVAIRPTSDATIT